MFFSSMLGQNILFEALNDATGNKNKTQILSLQLFFFVHSFVVDSFVFTFKLWIVVYYGKKYLLCC